MGNTCPLDVESLKRPVAGGDGTDKRLSDGITTLTNQSPGIERTGTVGLFQNFVHSLFELAVKSLERIFKEQRQKLTGKF